MLQRLAAVRQTGEERGDLAAFQKINQPRHHPLGFGIDVYKRQLFSLGKWQLRQLESRFPQRGAIISGLLSEPQDLLATLVLGNSFANAGIVMVALWLAVRRQWPLPPVLAALLLLILFGAEVAPKTLAVRAPELWALSLIHI